MPTRMRMHTRACTDAQMCVRINVRVLGRGPECRFVLRQKWNHSYSSRLRKWILLQILPLAHTLPMNGLPYDKDGNYPGHVCRKGHLTTNTKSSLA